MMDFLYDPSRIIVIINLYIGNNNAFITDLLLHSQLNTSNSSNRFNDFSKLQVVPIQYSNISKTNSSSETSHHQSITVVSKEQKQQYIIQPIPPTLETIAESKKRLLGKLDKNTKKQLDTLRKTMDITVPYTEEELRKAAFQNSNYSTVYTNRNRSDFYTTDPNFKMGHSPVLMDGFTYCEGSTLVVEAIFNLKYMLDNLGKKEKTNRNIPDGWICSHNGKTVKSNYPKDPQKHVIITVFNFVNQCSTANDHHYEIRAEKGKYHYVLDLEFLPNFHTQRYYLSLCVFLQYAPVREVIAFINHYFFHGVQHFVFNINGQLDYWKEALKKYNDHGIVDIVDFTFPNKKPFHEQQVVMNSCNRRYRYATQFMIQCDVDEFFLPLNPRWRIIDVVRLYDLAYPNMDAFSVDICFDY